MLRFQNSWRQSDDDERQNREQGVEDGAGGVDARREAVERGTGGAEVGDWGEGEALLPELLRHGADGGADAEVVLDGGVAELGEHGGREIRRRRGLHIHDFHGRSPEREGAVRVLKCCGERQRRI